MERDANLQTETTVNGSIIRSKIIWKADCTYEMYVNSESKTKLSAFDSMIARMPAQVEITGIGHGYYTYKATVKQPGVFIELNDTIYCSK